MFLPKLTMSLPLPHLYISVFFIDVCIIVCCDYVVTTKEMEEVMTMAMAKTRTVVAMQ